MQRCHHSMQCSPASNRAVLLSPQMHGMQMQPGREQTTAPLLTVTCNQPLKWAFSINTQQPVRSYCLVQQAACDAQLHAAPARCCPLMGMPGQPVLLPPRLMSPSSASSAAPNQAHGPFQAQLACAGVLTTEWPSISVYRCSKWPSRCRWPWPVQEVECQENARAAHADVSGCLSPD